MSAKVTLVLFAFHLVSNSNAVGNNLNDISTIENSGSVLAFEESYLHFYKNLAMLAKQEQSVDISDIVDTILEQFRKEIVEVNGHVFKLPNLNIVPKDFFLDLKVDLLEWNVAGGQTLYRNGPATMKVTQPDGNLVIDVPLAIYNGTVESGILEFHLWGGTLSSTINGTLKDPTYHLQLTLFSEFIPPKITQLRITNRGLVHMTVNEYTSFLNWVFAILIIFVIILLLFISLGIIVCCLVSKNRRIVKEFENYKKLKDTNHND